MVDATSLPKIDRRESTTILELIKLLSFNYIAWLEPIIHPNQCSDGLVECLCTRQVHRLRGACIKLPGEF